MRWGLLLIGLMAIVVAGTACANDAQQERPYRAVASELANDSPRAAAAPMGMGFFVMPSVPSVAATLALVPKMGAVSDYAMIQREVPWTRIAKGDSFEKIIDEEYVGLVNLLRGNGLKIVLLVDPLDGLNRRNEALEATKNDKTLKDAATRAIHAAWVKALVAKIQPDYIGLASEINTMAALGDRALYEEIRDMCNALAPELRQISPKSRVFVSFQVDEAWGNPPFPKSSIDEFALSKEFDVDVVGLSSYPGFVFSNRADVPGNYFSRFTQVNGKPLLLAEGGWASAGGPNFTPEKQAAYYQRLFELLDGAHAELAILLLYNDLNLADPAWALPPDRQQILQNFATMGIVDAQGRAKPAFATWEPRFKRDHH